MAPYLTQGNLLLMPTDGKLSSHELSIRVMPKTEKHIPEQLLLRERHQGRKLSCLIMLIIDNLRVY